MQYKFILLSIASVLVLSSCKKDKDSSDNYSSTQILNDFSVNVAQATYNDLASKTAQLHQAITDFTQNQTQANLDYCKLLWKESRQAWEQSEGFLFGPVATDDIDPRIDTWPVDFNSLDSVLNNQSVYDETYVNSLEDALKGFHPVEYLLWGVDGNKTILQFTSRQLDYLEALAANLKTLTQQVATSWTTGNYHNEFANAGNGSQVFTTQHAAFMEMVNAMAGICEEVADGKMEDPLVSQNAMLEESPFAKNSIIDFTNNIKSVENVYLGKYTSQGQSLESFVRANNLSLDGSIKTKISAAVTALGNITVPFGQAIFTQQTQVINAQNAIRELKEVLENDLANLVSQKIQ